MSIRKDPKTGVWQLDISIDGRPRYQRSSFTTVKKEAQEMHDKIKTDIWRQVNLGEKPKYTWAELIKQFLAEKELNGKRSIEDDRDKLRWLNKHLDNGKMLVADIDKTFVQSVLDIKRKEGNVRNLKDGTQTVKPLSNATINRYSALIHSVMQFAVHKDWITTAPTVKKLKEPKEKISYLTQEQAADLIYELPEHLVPMVRFSLATGLRQSNVTHLEWQNINLDRKLAWVWSINAKGKSDITIPLSDEAIAVLKSRLGKHEKYVFADEWGNPYLRPAGKSFYSACKRAGISENFTWHDLRHTWATWHVMSGTPLEVLMKLGGWKTLAMVLKYAHMAESHLANHANNISLPLPIASNKLNLKAVA
ncbi:MAG: integrase [Methylotenera sp.]|nr:MAG: integrase [Methylotenera sp.]PPD17731.1 MAG: integrase [Methylotenera sp.]